VMTEVAGRIIERFATNLAARLAGGSLPEASLAAGNGAGPGAAAPVPAATGPAVESAAADSVPASRGAAGAPLLEELNLPVRAHNNLRRAGIHTAGDLSGRTEGELLAIENLGPQSVSRIKQRLADLGLHLAQPGQGEQATAAAGVAAAKAGTADAGDGAGSRTGADEAPGAARAPLPNGAGGPAAPRGARPPDEDAIDLLSVAGFPVLKRALPVLAVVVALLLVVLGIRRRTRAGG